MVDCCLIKKVATVEVYENKNEVRAYGFMAGDRNTPVMEVRFKHLWGESNLSSCKLRWIIVDDVGSLLVGEVPIQSDNTALINLPNELFTGDRRMKVQLTVASCDGERILNLQQFTDLKVINSLAPNEVVEPVYQILINQLYDETQKYLSQLDTLYTSQYGSLENLYVGARASLEEYLITADNGGNAEFLQGYSPAHFQKVENTINDLIASTKYSVGDVVEVLGYYSAGDGGGHPRQKKPVGYNGADAVIGNDGSIWGIVHSGEINVSWFGAKGDGTTDDTEAIQNAIVTSNVVNLDKKTYMINSIKNGSLQNKDLHGLKTKNGLVFNFNGGVLKSLKSSSDRYTVLRVDSDMVYLNNPVIIGDRDEHITTPSSNPNNVDGFTGEWGYGIQFVGCSNVYVKNPIVTKCWGDSYVIDNATNLVIENPYGAYSRRQGMSLISGENIKIINPVMENISGTKPQAGIDIEPDTANEKLKNVFIDNLVSKNCAGDGFVIALIKQNSSTPTYNIDITNITTENTSGVQMFFGKDSKNLIKVGSINSESCRINSLGKNTFVSVSDITTDSSLKLTTSTSEGVINDPTKICIGNLHFKNTVNYVIDDFTADGTSFTNEKPTVFIDNVTGNLNNSRLTFSRKLSVNINNVYTYDSSDTAGANVNLSTFSGNIITLNKPIDANITINKNCTLTGTKTKIYNKSDKNIIIKCDVNTYVNGTKNDLVINGKSEFVVFSDNGIDYTVNVIYETQPISTTLDTPYHANNMSKLGILDSYYNYLTELHEYEKSQNVHEGVMNGVMNLNILQPPTIPLEIEEYAKEYNLI